MTAPYPEVYAADLGEDSSTLYVPTARYPTPLGALRAIGRHEWGHSAALDGWYYIYHSTQNLAMHRHGPDENCNETPECATLMEVHVFDATG